MTPHSRGAMRPSFAGKFLALQSEGAGNAGRPMRPQPGRAEKTSHASNSHHGHTGNHPAFPAQWFYGFLRALPGDRACLPPSTMRIIPQKLDTSVGVSGPHDFAVRLKRLSSIAPSASTASRPAPVTIASRPSEWDGTEWI